MSAPVYRTAYLCMFLFAASGCGSSQPRPAPGQPAMGQAAMGQAAMGQPAMGQAAMGQPAMGQAPTGQAPTGSPQVAPPAAGQPAPPAIAPPGAVVHDLGTACRSGDDGACELHAAALIVGHEVARDEPAAFNLLTAICGRQRATACTALGLMQHLGRGTPVDEAGANATWQLACKLGEGQACAMAAWQFATGRGVTRSPARAQQLRRDGCDRAYCTLPDPPPPPPTPAPALEVVVREGRVQLGAVKVSGGLERSDAARQFAMARPGLRSCYERSLKADPSLAGELDVAVDVAADGQVSAARVMPSGQFPEAMETCMLQRLRRLRFPTPSTLPATGAAHMKLESVAGRANKTGADRGATVEPRELRGPVPSPAANGRPRRSCRCDDGELHPVCALEC